jgi:lysophospholipase L1-like esterase
MLSISYSCAQPPEVLKDLPSPPNYNGGKSDNAQSNDDTSAPAEGSETVESPAPTTIEPAPEPVLVPEPEPVVIVKPYNPCPAKGSDCLIMPFGDSITAGAGSKNGGGYREPLMQLLWNANKGATFVGPNNGGPEKLDGKPFPRANAGYSGYTIEKSTRAGIAELAPGLLEKYKPHIITLMIGTNDIGTNNDLVNAPKRLEKLMELIFTNSPDSLLVLAQIVPSGSEAFNIKVKTYNASIAELVKTKAALGKHVVLVNQYEALDGKTNVLNDTLHPNEAGYLLMADTWYKGISPFLP